VSAFVFFPDGRTLAAGYDNGTVVLWNVAHPAHITRVATLAGRAGGAVGLSMSPDGHLLASVGGSGTVVLWGVADPARAIRIATLTGQAAGGGSVSALSFSPDGHLLATASDNGTVVLRDVTDPAAPVITATLRFTVPPPRFPGQATPPDVEFAFSADGHTLTTIAGNTRVTRWDVTNPKAVTLITTIARDSLGAGAVAVAPGGRAVAGAPTAGDTLALWTLP
jgi:WD40 repeat protein